MSLHDLQAATTAAQRPSHECRPPARVALVALAPPSPLLFSGHSVYRRSRVFEPDSFISAGVASSCAAFDGRRSTAGGEGRKEGQGRKGNKKRCSQSPLNARYIIAVYKDGADTLTRGERPPYEVASRRKTRRCRGRSCGSGRRARKGRSPRAPHVPRGLEDEPRPPPRPDAAPFSAVSRGLFSFLFVRPSLGPTLKHFPPTDEPSRRIFQVGG